MPSAGAAPAHTKDSPLRSVGRGALIFRLLVVGALLFGLGGDAFSVYFSSDDVMNLYKYVEKGWSVAKGVPLFWLSDYYRPVGGVTYLGIYALFGFSNLAFKIVLFALLTLNLALAWRLSRQLLGDARAAAFSVLLISYHAAQNDLYYNFGIIYDVLCFSFVLCACLLWIRLRRDGRNPGAGGIALLCSLLILSLGAKEMGVCIPVFLLIWEVVGSGSRPIRPFSLHWRPVAVIALLSVIVLIYIAGKSSGPESLTSNPLYKPTFTLSQYLTAMTHYLNQLFYCERFGPRSTVVFLVGGLALAGALRLRAMAFGWLWFIVGTLPVAFITPRSCFVLYLPSVGLAVAATDLLARFSRAFQWSRAAALLTSPAALPLFLASACALFAIHRSHKPIYDPDMKAMPAVRAVWAQDLLSASPLSPRASVLFLSDPYPDDYWDPLFLTSLVAKDPHLAAARAKKNHMLLSPAVEHMFSDVFDYRNGHLIHIDNSAPGQLAKPGGNAGRAEPGRGIYYSTDPWWWTEKDFEILSQCPAGKPSCTLDVTLVTPIGQFVPGEQRIMKISAGARLVAEKKFQAAYDSLGVTVPVAGGEPSVIGFHLDQALPSARTHDPRPLGIIISGALVR